MVLEPQLRLVLQGVVDHHSLPDPADPRAKDPRGGPQPDPQTDRVEPKLLARVPSPGSALPVLAAHLRVPAGIGTHGRNARAEGPGLCQAFGPESGRILPGSAQPQTPGRIHASAQGPSQRAAQAFPGHLDPTPSPSAAEAPAPHGLGDIHRHEIFPVDIRRGQIPPTRGQTRPGRQETMRPESGEAESFQVQRARPTRAGFHALRLGRQGRIGFQGIPIADPGRIGASAPDHRRGGKRPFEGAPDAEEGGGP